MANKNSGRLGMDNKEMVAAGAGVAALAAGIYFFFGPDGKKHQKKMKGWMVRMKGEVLEKLEDAKEISEPVYNEIVDTVAKTYSVAGKVPREEIMALAQDLKRQWRTISRAQKASAPKRKPAAKKAAPKKRAAKKTKK